MLTVSPTTQPELLLLASAARLLSSDMAFAERIRELFGLLHEGVQFYDARLVYWPPSLSGQQNAAQLSTAEGWHRYWIDDLTELAVQRGAPVQTTIPFNQLLDSASGELPDEISYFGTPIIWGEQTWGVLELRTPGAGAFSPSEQAFVAALMPLLASAIAVEQGDSALPVLAQPTAELTIEQSHELTVLRQEMEAPLSLTALLTLLLRQALDSTGAEAGAISLVDAERGELVVHVHEGFPFPGTNLLGESRRRVSWEQGAMGRAARTSRSILVRDVNREPDYQPGNPQIRAELAIPIIADTTVLAVLVLLSPRTAAFGASEVAYAQAICMVAPQPLRRALRYQELLETSTQLNQVVTSMPIGLALLDPQGRVLRHNPAWQTLWGIDDEGEHTPFHVPWDLVPLILARLVAPMEFNDFCASGLSNPTEVQTITLRLRDPHQELDVLSIPTRDSLGQLTGRLWLVSDVTREREADRLKSEFISVVSHELRTPLTSILGYTELLLAREFAPAEQREFVKTVYNEANHLSQMVEDMLGISRLEAGTVKLNQWVVSVRQLINEMTAQLSHHLSSRHRMVIDIPDQLVPAYIDRDKIKQVLFNLLINAAKYSPRGGEIILSVVEATTLPPEHPPGRFLQVSVRDQGIGIAPEDLPRIWERFYRVDNTNTRRIGGTGLGLAITRALVELHGGRIWAESTVGKGSTFHFTMPVATEQLRP